MKLTDFLNDVARRTDTDTLKINAADTRRVIAVFFDLLEDLKPEEAFDIVAKGLAQAARRRR